MAVDESAPFAVPFEGEEMVGNYHMASSDALVCGELEAVGN